ncbi:MAG TPA: polysaccharide deacetylase family protein [Anaerolineales bacterium]|nr:polysaccharide deacetylase family protein [Anaerolineales bacterium]
MNNRSDFSLTRNAINYSWRQLALRAGIEDFRQQDADSQYFGVPLYYGFPEQIPYKGKKVVVIPCKDRDWAELVRRPAESIDWILPQAAFPDAAHLPFDYSIPVIFWGDSSQKGKIAECASDGTLIFHVDLLATAFFMLSRWEEMDRTLCDEHGRFPAPASVAYKHGFLDVPIVDLYGLLLREWFKVIAPGWRPTPAHFRINLTHDIDWIRHFSNFSQFARVAGSALLKQKKVGAFLKQFQNLYVQITAPAQDDYVRSIYHLADQSEAHGFSSRFYVMAAEANAYQQGYDPATPWLQECLENLRQRGHEIGIHPGYYTLGNPEQLIVEKQQLEKVLGENISGGRQHYLRFQAPSTWRHWEEAGLLYDSSMGYAEHEGFRAGTCHPYRPFDIESDREMLIEEIPLIVMDTSLRYYRRFSGEEAKRKMLTLAQRCADVDGVFTMLWHNTSFSGDWMEWGLMYPDVLNALSAMANP